MLRPVARTTRRDLRPLIRLTANPGGRGHLWLRRGFVDPAPPRTVFTDPDSQKTRVFVPATVYDNPHVSASTIRDLEGLPEPQRSAWLLGRWDVFVGQFFSEWNPAVHLCEPFEIPSNWRRFGMLDYGYRDPTVYLQAAVSPDKQIFVYREIVLRQEVDETQAARIAEICAGDSPEYVAAAPDMWNQSGKGPKGQSSAETFVRAWDRCGFRVHLQPGANDRWNRTRQCLAPYTGAEGTPTAVLQIFRERCSELVRTLPALVFDEHRTEDCADGDDHAPDALRYGLMSRPAPKPAPKPGPVSDFDVQAMLQTRQDRLRRMGYIGNEIEAMRYGRSR